MQADRKVLVGLYSATCIAMFALWIGEDEAVPYPWIVILCAVASFAFTDVWGRLFISTTFAPLFALPAISLLIWEELRLFWTDPIRPLGHLLIYLQVLVFFHRKTPWHYWCMLLMSFLQVAIAALENNRVGFGLLLAAYLSVMLWTLTQVLLSRERDRCGCTAESGRTGWRGVPRFIGSTAVVLLGGLGLFLLLPRHVQSAWTHSAFQPSRYLSGFDQEIRLGQLGTILESDEEVMTVRLFDEDGQVYRPADEPLWRGIALNEYHDGRWQRATDIAPNRRSPWRVPRPARYVRQEIDLQAIQQEVLFALRPAFGGATRAGFPLELARIDGAVVRPEDLAPGALQYTVYSGLPDGQDQPGEYPATDFDPQNPRYYQLVVVSDPRLRAALNQYLDQVISPDVRSSEEIARLVLSHLRDSGLFTYTLEAEVGDPSVDPVLDFLSPNRRAGHCEYFASALALLLRSRGVPARVVNGFKGGDWTELLGGQFYVVRQKHAHSWVEAIVESGGRRRWVTLDPTPGDARQQLVEQIHWRPSLVRQTYDVARRAWWHYVLNFNRQEQEEVVYGPIRRLATQQLAEAVRSVRAGLTQRPGSFNWPVAAAASGAMAAAILLLWIVARLVRRVVAALPRGSEGLPERSGRLRDLMSDWIRTALARMGVGGSRRRVAFYQRLLRVLEAQDIGKLPAMTPREFAAEAALALERLPRAAAVATVPVQLIDRFYRVRFGQRRPDAQESEEIERMLKKLETALT